MPRLSKRLATPLLCLSLALPVQADDAGRIVGGILGAIVQEQSRQQQQRELQRQQQQYQQQQQRYQQQQQRRQQNAQRQAPAAPQQPRMSLAQRKAVQRALREAGFYGGAIDGALGPGSRKAIAAWQDSVGAAPSGYLAPRQASTLAAQAPPPDPEPEPDPDFASDFAQDDPGEMPAFPAGPETALFPEAPADAPDAAPPAAELAAFDPAGAGVIRDPDQLHAAYLFWALSRAPDQLWLPRIASHYGKMPLKDGTPAPYGLQPAELRPLVEAAVAHYGQHPPRLAVLDLPMQKGANTTDDSGLAQRATHWFPELRGNLTDISGVPAITEWRLRGASGGLELLLAPEKPFFLAVPADYRTAWAQPVNATGRPVLRVEMQLDGLEPSADLAGWPMGKARIAIQRATLLVVSDRDRSTGAAAERVLHSWTGAAPEAQKVDRPADAAAIAAIYGVTARDGRILTTPDRETRARSGQQGKAAPRALLQDRDAYGSSVDGLQLLDQALRLGALIDAGPDRPLDPALAQQAANILLTKRERVELLPTALAVDGSGGYANGLSELSVRKAMNQADPALRRLIAGRAPQLPVPLRAVLTVRLGEYDFDAGGFPLEVQRSSAAWLPDALMAQGEGRAVPQFFRIDADNAEKLLAHLARSGSMDRRSVYLVADYALAAMRVRPPAGARISMAELETVTPRVHVETLALFADAAARTRIRDLSVPAALAAPPEGAAPAQAGTLPDEIFATTGKTLMAAVAARQPEALAAGMLDPPEIAGLPADQRAARAAEYRAALPGLARDSYWIAALMQVDAYDPALAGFPTRQVSFQPVPYAQDLSGVGPPSLDAASRADYELLRVPADRAAAVAALMDANGGLRMFLNVPIAEARAAEGEYPALRIGAPTEAILGRGDLNLWPDTPELRLALAPPDRLAWVAADPARPTGIPETLMLDPEGLDLLALAADADLYDEAGLRRMLLERLAKEQAAAANPAMRLDWARFFRDPARRMEPAALDAMLPAFRSWTLARAALLPQRVVLPVTRGGTHPLTGCLGASELGRVGQQDEDRLFHANARALIGQPLPAVERVLALNGTRPRPGPARLWTLGEPRRGPASNCPFLSRGGDGAAASHAGLVLQVEAQPELSPLPDTALVAASYELALTERRLVGADRLSEPPEGMRAMLVLRATVAAVRLYGNRQGVAGTAEIGQLAPGDWQPVTAAPPAAQDVLGMTLGMSLADFDKAARAHLPQADLLATVKPGEGPFGTAQAYLDPATGEALAAVFAPQSPDRTVVAIMRHLEFPETEISLEGLKASLVEKYGPAIRLHRDTEWSWGTLPQDEDAYGFCGGQSTLNPQSAAGQPEFGSDDPAVRQRLQANPRGNVLLGFGWPTVALGGQGAEPELARCGAVVTVRVEPHARAGTVILRLWLADRKLAEELAAKAAPVEPPRPKVRF